MAFASLWFLTRFETCRSSMPMMSWFLTISVDIFCKQSVSGIADLFVDAGDFGALLLVVFRFGELYARPFLACSIRLESTFLFLGKLPFQLAESPRVLVNGLIGKDGGNLFQADIDAADGTRLSQFLNFGFD